MYHYLLPIIIPIPKGYNCCSILPVNQIKSRLIGTDDYKIIINCKCVNESKVIITKKIETTISKKKTLKDIIINFDDLSVKYDYPAYVDLEITSSDRNLIFSSNKGLGFYSIFTNKTKKTFLSDNAFKHGAASIIYQISVLKRYVDTDSKISFKNIFMLKLSPIKKGLWKEISCFCITMFL